MAGVEHHENVDTAYALSSGLTRWTDRGREVETGRRKGKGSDETVGQTVTGTGVCIRTQIGSTENYL
eukprot:6183442-Pleurochrysis_carterae.AAC.1